MNLTCPPRRTLWRETVGRAPRRGQVIPRLEHKKSDSPPCVGGSIPPRATKLKTPVSNDRGFCILGVEIFLRWPQSDVTVADFG